MAQKYAAWTAVLYLILIAGCAPSPRAGDDDGRTVFVQPAEELASVPTDLKTGWDSIGEVETGEYLMHLASDRMEGRETANPGHESAARFVSGLLSSWGIQPAASGPGGEARTYFQQVRIGECVADESSLFLEILRDGKNERHRLNLGVDYKFAPVRSYDLRAAVVVAGYGLCEPESGWDDYEDLDVAGKAVLILSGLPPKFLHPFDADTRGKFIAKYQRFNHCDFSKFEIARAHGAAAVLYVVRNWRKNAAETRGRKRSAAVQHPPLFKRRLHLPRSSFPPITEVMPVVVICENTADLFLGAVGRTSAGLKKELSTKSSTDIQNIKGVSLVIESRVETRETTSSNVLGFIRGRDPKYRDEVIIVGAHLDHLGRLGAQIYNGANDNGSGTVAVLQVAKAFADNRIKPRRSVLFAFWTGEEVRLLGSRHYVDHAVFPIEKTRAYLNLDAVGCRCSGKRSEKQLRKQGVSASREALSRLEESGLIMPVVADRAPALAQTLDACNRVVGLSLLLRRIRRVEWHSDYAPFDWCGVPWISFYSGRSPHHHLPTDTADTVDLTLVQRVARLTYLTVFALADS